MWGSLIDVQSAEVSPSSTQICRENDKDMREKNCRSFCSLIHQFFHSKESLRKQRKRERKWYRKELQWSKNRKNCWSINETKWKKKRKNRKRELTPSSSVPLSSRFSTLLEISVSCFVSFRALFWRMMVRLVTWSPSYKWSIVALTRIVKASCHALLLSVTSHMVTCSWPFVTCTTTWVSLPPEGQTTGLSTSLTIT